MRVPLSWLNEFVELPAGSTAESVMAELVKVGLEEEGSHSFSLVGPIVVGQVLEFVEEEQSNGKTICGNTVVCWHGQHLFSLALMQNSPRILTRPPFQLFDLYPHSFKGW